MKTALIAIIAIVTIVFFVAETQTRDLTGKAYRNDPLGPRVAYNWGHVVFNFEGKPTSSKATCSPLKVGNFEKKFKVMRVQSTFVSGAANNEVSIWSLSDSEVARLAEETDKHCESSPANRPGSFNGPNALSTELDNWDALNCIGCFKKPPLKKDCKYDISHSGWGPWRTNKLIITVTYSRECSLTRINN